MIPVTGMDKINDTIHAAAVDDAVLRNAAAFVRALFANDAGGHDAEHSMRVGRSAALIAREEADCDARLCVLAALLHDADDPKLFETRGNANARRFLAANGVSPETTDRICAIINSVSFSANRNAPPDSIEGMVVRDADRLDAIGAVGVARAFAYGGAHARPMAETIRHFHDKLLLLRDMMCTRTGRRLAEERHAFLEAFLARYRQETGDPNDML